MEKDKFFDSLDGLYAYDNGCTDSGIHDDRLKDEIDQYLYELEDKGMKILWEFLTEVYTPAKGYTIEDAKHFIRWIEETFEIDI